MVVSMVAWMVDLTENSLALKKVGYWEISWAIKTAVEKGI